MSVGFHTRASQSQTAYVTILVVDEECGICESLVSEPGSQHQSAVASVPGHNYAKVVAPLENVHVSLRLRFGEKRRAGLDEFVTLHVSALHECEDNILLRKSLVGLDLLSREDTRMLQGYPFLTLLRNPAQKGQLPLSLPHAASIVTRDNEAIASEVAA